MALSVSFLDKIDTSYGAIDNDIANSKMNRLSNIRSIFKTSYDRDTLNNSSEKYLEIFNNELNNLDNKDYLSVFNYINEFIASHIYNKDNKLNFLNLLNLIKYLLISYKKSNYNDTDEILNNILNQLENIVDNDNVLLNDPNIDTQIKFIGSIISDIKMKFKECGIPIPYTTPLNRAKTIQINSIITENVDLEDMNAGTVIKSITNYSISKYFPQLTTVKFDPNDYLLSVFTENDPDYLINKLYNIPEFLISRIKTSNIESDFRSLVDYFLNKLSNNSTAIHILSNILNECIDKLNGITSDDYTFNETIYNIKAECERNLDYIEKYANSSIDFETTPLIEMGFGYIYNILPSNIEDITYENSEKIGDLLNEAIDEYNLYGVLTEGIFSKGPSISEQKKQDDYDFNKQKQQDKYAFKNQKKQDKYELKKQRKQEKYEKKQIKKEEKANETKTLGVKWKTLELSTPAIYSAIRALKRLLAAGAMGAVSYAAGFNAVFIPIMYLIGRYLGDKRFPGNEKRKVMMEIRSNLQQIEEKINEADRKGNMKQKYQLMKMKEKMDTLYKRYNFGISRGGVI